MFWDRLVSRTNFYIRRSALSPQMLREQPTLLQMRQSVVVADLPKFHSPKEYQDFACSPEATPDQLRELSTSSYPFVLQAVAANRSTPPDALQTLVPQELQSWNDAVMLSTLIRNPATPIAALEAAPDLILARPHDRDGQRAFEAGVALTERLTPRRTCSYSWWTTREPRQSSAKLSPEKRP